MVGVLLAAGVVPAEGVAGAWAGVPVVAVVVGVLLAAGVVPAEGVAGAWAGVPVAAGGVVTAGVAGLLLAPEPRLLNPVPGVRLVVAPVTVPSPFWAWASVMALGL